MTKYYGGGEILNYISETDILSFGSPCNKLYRSDIIRDNTLTFDESTVLFEDICFNYRYLEHCNKIYRHSDLVYCYDVNDTSATSKFHGDVFRNDLHKFLDQERMIVESIASRYPSEQTQNDIYHRSRVTALHNCLYELYGMYRQATFNNSAKKRHTREMIAFMKSIDEKWHRHFQSGFPHIFASIGRHSSGMAHYLLTMAFYFKSMR